MRLGQPPSPRRPPGEPFGASQLFERHLGSSEVAAAEKARRPWRGEVAEDGGVAEDGRVLSEGVSSEGVLSGRSHAKTDGGSCLASSTV